MIVSIPFSATAQGDNVVIQGVEGKYLDIWSIVLYSSGVSDLSAKSGENPLTGVMRVASGNGIVLPQGSVPIFRVEQGSSFILHLATPSGTVAGFLSYEETL